MTGLPIPPPAYWENVPWWIYLIFLVVIAILTSPFAIQVLRGRGEAYVSREQAYAASREKLDAQRNDFLAMVQLSEKDCRAILARERAEWEKERDVLTDDRETGWDLGRGMEDKAHWYRHELISVSMRFNALLDLFRDVVRGTIAPERAQALLDQVKPAGDVPKVPPLRDVTRIKPGFPPPFQI